VGPFVCLLALAGAAQLWPGDIRLGESFSELKVRYPSCSFEGTTPEGLEEFQLNQLFTALISKNAVVAVVITNRRAPYQGIAIGDARNKVLSKLGRPQHVKADQYSLSDGVSYKTELWQYPSRGLEIGISKPAGEADVEFRVGSIILFKPGSKPPAYPR